MWDKLKQWFRRGQRGGPRWHEIGDDNPFGLRFLDCRPVTWNLVTTTQNPAIAESYTRLRGSDGRDLKSVAIEDPVRIPVSLRFPHNGAALDGIVFKADAMEVKWDIYIYDSVFLFARSWTGDLQYRAWAGVGPDEIRITEIECSKSQQDLAPQHVFFLMATHAMGRVLPHRVPLSPDDSPQAISLLSFSLFGRLGCYAAFDDITGIPLSRPQRDGADVRRAL